MNRTNIFFLFALLLIFTLSLYQLTGCGAGSAGSSSSSGATGGTVFGSAKYYINVTLKFPEKKQELFKNQSAKYNDFKKAAGTTPSGCLAGTATRQEHLYAPTPAPFIINNEILSSKLSPALDYYEVKLKKEGTQEQIGETKNVERPSTGNQAIVTFYDVPEGRVQLLVKGYNTDNVVVGEGESTIDVSLTSVTGNGGSGALSGGNSGNNTFNNEPVVLPTGTVVDGPSAPKISDVSPRTICIGDTVTIRGCSFGKRDRNFEAKFPAITDKSLKSDVITLKDDKESCVYFGGIKATEYVYWSDDYIVCRVPKNASLGNLNVCVSIAGGCQGALISAGSSSSTVVSVVNPPSGGGGGGSSSVVDSTLLTEVPAITAGNYTTVNLRLGGGAGAYATGTQIQQISSFYIGQFEITNTDYCAFLNASDVAGSNNPGEGGTTWWDSTASATYNGIIYTAGSAVGSRYTIRSGFANRPVVYVSWYGAIAYCNWLTLQKGMTVGDQCYGGFAADGLTRWGASGANYHPERKGYRLPTEAEWEYACRFITATTISTTDCYWGENYNNPAGSPFNIGTYCWYVTNSASNHHDVGNKTPNGLGLYDINGNAWEWCSDVYNGTFPFDDFAGGSAVINPKGTKTVGANRSARGGGWTDASLYCSSYFRTSFYTPDTRHYAVGFRLVRTK